MWQLEFSEVFQEGGFDIVIGNPPYVRQELIIPIKPALRALFPEVYTGTADLYIYFYKRGCELLRGAGFSPTSPRISFYVQGMVRNCESSLPIKSPFKKCLILGVFLFLVRV